MPPPNPRNMGPPAGGVASVSANSMMADSMASPTSAPATKQALLEKVHDAYEGIAARRTRLVFRDKAHTEMNKLLRSEYGACSVLSATAFHASWLLYSSKLKALAAGTPKKPQDDQAANAAAADADSEGPTRVTFPDASEDSLDIDVAKLVAGAVIKHCVNFHHPKSFAFSGGAGTTTRARAGGSASNLVQVRVALPTRDHDAVLAALSFRRIGSLHGPMREVVGLLVKDMLAAREYLYFDEFLLVAVRAEWSARISRQIASPAVLQDRAASLVCFYNPDVSADALAAYMQAVRDAHFKPTKGLQVKTAPSPRPGSARRPPSASSAGAGSPRGGASRGSGGPQSSGAKVDESLFEVLALGPRLYRSRTSELLKRPRDDFERDVEVSQLQSWVAVSRLMPPEYGPCDPWSLACMVGGESDAFCSHDGFERLTEKLYTVYAEHFSTATNPWRADAVPRASLTTSVARSVGIGITDPAYVRALRRACRDKAPVGAGVTMAELIHWSRYAREEWARFQQLARPDKISEMSDADPNPRHITRARMLERCREAFGKSQGRANAFIDMVRGATSRRDEQDHVTFDEYCVMVSCLADPLCQVAARSAALIDDCVDDATGLALPVLRCLGSTGWEDVPSWLVADYVQRALAKALSKDKAADGIASSTHVGVMAPCATAAALAVLGQCTEQPEESRPESPVADRDEQDADRGLVSQFRAAASACVEAAAVVAHLIVGRTKYLSGPVPQRAWRLADLREVAAVASGADREIDDSEWALLRKTIETFVLRVYAAPGALARDHVLHTDGSTTAKPWDPALSFVEVVAVCEALSSMRLTFDSWLDASGGAAGDDGPRPGLGDASMAELDVGAPPALAVPPVALGGGPATQRTPGTMDGKASFLTPRSGSGPDTFSVSFLSPRNGKKLDPGHQLRNALPQTPAWPDRVGAPLTCVLARELLASSVDADLQFDEDSQIAHEVCELQTRINLAATAGELPFSGYLELLCDNVFSRNLQLVTTVMRVSQAWTSASDSGGVADPAVHGQELQSVLADAGVVVGSHALALTSLWPASAMKLAGWPHPNDEDACEAPSQAVSPDAVLSWCRSTQKFSMPALNLFGGKGLVPYGGAGLSGVAADERTPLPVWTTRLRSDAAAVACGGEWLRGPTLRPWHSVFGSVPLPESVDEASHLSTLVRLLAAVKTGSTSALAALASACSVATVPNDDECDTLITDLFSHALRPVWEQLSNVMPTAAVANYQRHVLHTYLSEDEGSSGTSAAFLPKATDHELAGGAVSTVLHVVETFARSVERRLPGFVFDGVEALAELALSEEEDDDDGSVSGSVSGGASTDSAGGSPDGEDCAPSLSEVPREALALRGVFTKTEALGILRRQMTSRWRVSAAANAITWEQLRPIRYMVERRFERTALMPTHRAFSPSRPREFHLDLSGWLEPETVPLATLRAMAVELFQISRSVLETPTIDAIRADALQAVTVGVSVTGERLEQIVCDFVAMTFREFSDRDGSKVPVARALAFALDVRLLSFEFGAVSGGNPATTMDRAWIHALGPGTWSAPGCLATVLLTLAMTTAGPPSPFIASAVACELGATRLGANMSVDLASLVSIARVYRALRPYGADDDRHSPTRLV